MGFQCHSCLCSSFSWGHCGRVTPETLTCCCCEFALKPLIMPKIAPEEMLSHLLGGALGHFSISTQHTGGVTVRAAPRAVHAAYSTCGAYRAAGPLRLSWYHWRHVPCPAARVAFQLFFFFASFLYFLAFLSVPLPAPVYRGLLLLFFIKLLFVVS